MSTNSLRVSSMIKPHIPNGSNDLTTSSYCDMYRKYQQEQKMGSRESKRTAKSESSGSPKSTISRNKNPRDGCCWQGNFFFDALKAIITRLVFLAHAMLAVWRVTYVTQTLYWLFSLSFVGMFVETVFILFKRRGQEWSWFQWSIFLYLCGVVPPIWILELTNLGHWDNFLNNTYFSQQVNEQFTAEVFSLNISTDTWMTVIQQGLLVVLIIGRWFMPKGDLSREQLSALLLNYLGTASDIVDFMSILSEPNISGHTTFLFTILFCWTWSLFQFPFVVTSTKKSNHDEEDDDDDENDDKVYDYEDMFDDETNIDKAHQFKTKLRQRKKKILKVIRNFFETEAWGIFVSVLMQDGPYVIMRLIAILNFHIKTYTNYFFTAKNALVLLLQVYRLWSIYHEHQKKKQKEKNLKGAEKLNQMYRSAFELKPAKS